MKTRSFFHHVLIVLSILVGVSCNRPSQTQLSVEERLAIEDTIRQLARIVEEGANHLDIDASFSLFTDEPDFTFSEDGYILPPKDLLYEIMKPAYDNFSNIFMSYDTMRVAVLNETAAVFTVEGPWFAVDHSGNQMGGHLVSMFVFARRNNRWQMIHGHTSHTYK